MKTPPLPVVALFAASLVALAVNPTLGVTGFLSTALACIAHADYVLRRQRLALPRRSASTAPLLRPLAPAEAHRLAA